MDDVAHARFQALVDAFQLDKAGASPFDAGLLDRSVEGASHGEKVSIAFLLNVWNPNETRCVRRHGPYVPRWMRHLQ